MLVRLSVDEQSWLGRYFFTLITCIEQTALPPSLTILKENELAQQLQQIVNFSNIMFRV